MLEKVSGIERRYVIYLVDATRSAFDERWYPVLIHGECGEPGQSQSGREGVLKGGYEVIDHKTERGSELSHLRLER